MYTILSSEILGYNTVQYFSLGTWASLHYLSGCVDGVMPAVNCTGPPQRHVALELWESGWQDPDWLAKADFLGSERAVQTSGSMGFSGVEGMFVMGRTRQNALERSGLHLSYYGNFNASWFNPADYAPHVSEVNMSKLLTCAESNPPGAQNYIQATGDADGVETRNGVIVYKCWQEKWWVAPACRNNPSSCIAVITLRGWGNREISQQAFFHNMPLAIASALEFPEYVELNVQHQSFLFWWTPDSTFVEYDAVLVEMPPWNPSEQKQGILRSSMKQSMLTTGTSPILETAADRAWGLARALRLSDSNVNDLLLLSVQNGDDYYAAACTWLKANQHVWDEWVPDKTKCSIGRGMVNSQGDFVTSRADAVDCTICPAGRASTKSSDSRLCTKCTPGFYQGTFGMSECNLCELGTMAVEEGAIQCDQCRLGEYANRTGMSFCYRCGAGSGQENLWTTSQEIDAEGESVVIKLQGAVSESYCHCDSGTFLWEGRCEVCMEGASCVGADRLELLPGYFSREELPGDVYNCFDERICPGGPAGTCAAGRDTSSVACADCKEGFREGNDMVCEACGDGDHAFFSMVVVVIIGVVAALYFVMLNETKWSFGDGCRMPTVNQHRPDAHRGETLRHRLARAA
ncbi:40S ribosomal protein S6 [Durusdinium trenchii]|uniref:40S ribosomal protein S6 n=1 Tax=Durusdinium trenchii TaxID=1381693 RepID=A0ABP0H694_9DINO